MSSEAPTREEEEQPIVIKADLSTTASTGLMSTSFLATESITEA